MWPVHPVFIPLELTIVFDVPIGLGAPIGKLIRRVIDSFQAHAAGPTEQPALAEISLQAKNKDLLCCRMQHSCGRWLVDCEESDPGAWFGLLRQRVQSDAKTLLCGTAQLCLSVSGWTH